MGALPSSPSSAASRVRLLLPVGPILTGLLMAAAFPRIQQGWIAWMAWVPLILAVIYVRGRWSAFFAGIATAATAYGILLSWMPSVLIRYGGIPQVGAWGAYVLLILFLACYPGAACLITKHLLLKDGPVWILLFPVTWVLSEFALSLSPLGGLPWLLAGYTQTDYLHVIQIADVTGVYGVSFLILSVNAAIAWTLSARRRCLQKGMPLLCAAALLAACLLYGHRSIERWERVSPDHLAAMLQGNLSADEPNTVLSEKMQRGYSRMADQLPPGSVDLVLLPESPAPLIFQEDEDYRNSMEALARRYPLGLVLSNIRYEEEEGAERRYYNSAFFLDREGKLAGTYDKIHLVPFGEYIPLAEWFFFAETISKDMGVFSPGSDYSVVDMGGRDVGAIICFEAAFPQLVRRFVREGSELILNLTNDGWYGRSAAPYQHLAIARFRAVENRRFFLRAANSGITACIEPTGRLQSSTGLQKVVIGYGHFSFLQGKTVYTRYGDAFILLCAIILTASGLVIVWKKRNNFGGSNARGAE